MRPILWMVVILLAVGAVASEMSLPQSDEGPTVDTSWRRTKDGWVQATQLEPVTTAQQPALHPFVVGSFLLLLSTLALVAMPATSRQKRRPEGVSATAPSPERARNWNLKTRSNPDHPVGAVEPLRTLTPSFIEKYCGGGGDI